MNLQIVAETELSRAFSVAVSPAEHRRHASHDGARMWPETNCYFDLWIEILHTLGLDPVPAFASVLAADHDGTQWTFIKPAPEDLRRLYGLEVAEENVWRPVLDTVESGPSRGILFTVEVDSWWLPDTEGTAYRADHVKTTIVPTRIDRPARSLWYLHNAGLFELSGDDFDGLFGLDGAGVVLPPYIEQISTHPDRVEPGAAQQILREHLARRADGNPVARLADAVRRAVDWLPAAGMGVFHLWSFANLRQCGASAELAADLVASSGLPAAAGQHFRAVAADAKRVQFKMARAAHGKPVDIDDVLARMVDDWQAAVDILVAAVT